MGSYAAPQGTELARIKLRQQQGQHIFVVRVFGHVPRVQQHVAYVVGGDEFHVSLRKQPFTHFFGFAQGHDVVVTRVGFQNLQQLGHRVERAFELLEKYAAAKHQQAGDAARRVPAVRRFDDAGYGRVMPAWFMDGRMAQASRFWPKALHLSLLASRRAHLRPLSVRHPFPPLMLALGSVVLCAVHIPGDEVVGVLDVNP